MLLLRAARSPELCLRVGRAGQAKQVVANLANNDPSSDDPGWGRFGSPLLRTNMTNGIQVGASWTRSSKQCLQRAICRFDWMSNRYGRRERNSLCLRLQRPAHFTVVIRIKEGNVRGRDNHVEAQISFTSGSCDPTSRPWQRQQELMQTGVDFTT